jgi:hypothetical protein
MPIRVLQHGEELPIDTAQQPEWVSDASISLGDVVFEGAVVNGEHLSISDPDWLDDGLEGLDFIDDIFVESVNVNESTPVNDHVYVDEHTTSTRPPVNVNADSIMPIAYVGAEDECVEKPVDDELNSVYDSDDDVRQHYKDFNVQTDMQKVELVNGMKFPNSQVFRQALREYVVRKLVDIKFKLNEKNKVSVYCKNECGWRLYASTISGEMTF